MTIRRTANHWQPEKFQEKKKKAAPIKKGEMSSKVARQLDFLAHDLATFRSGLQPGEIPVDLEKMASLQGNITELAWLNFNPLNRTDISLFCYF